MRQIWLAMLTVALAVPAWAEEPFSARLNLAEAYRLARAHDARLAAAEAARSCRRGGRCCCPRSISPPIAPTTIST